MADNAKVYEGLDSYINDSRTEFENKLGQLVEVPTISMEPERKPDIRSGGLTSGAGRNLPASILKASARAPKSSKRLGIR